MAKYEIEAEYDDPNEIAFKKKCIYCKKPTELKFQLVEKSKIGELIERPWISIIILFIIIGGALELIIPQYTTFGLAVLLASIVWGTLKIFFKNTFKDLFRYATAYICANCAKKCERVRYVGFVYGTLIFMVLILWAFWGFLYDPKTVPSWIVGVSVMGIFFGGMIVGFLENLFRGYLGLRFPNILLAKQGLIRGSTKLAMLEDDFKNFVEEDIDDVK